MEIWKDVVGYEGLYQVSNLGNIRSITRMREVKDDIRGRCYKAIVKGQNISQNKGGKYAKVILSKNDTRKSFLVHRLVAQAFVPNPNGLNEVNHIDENHFNNNSDNLEWVTHKQNMNHGTLLQRRKSFNTFKSPVLQCDLNGNIIAEYESIVEASRATNINKASISTGLSRRGYCKGYLWKYNGDMRRRSRIKEGKKL